MLTLVSLLVLGQTPPTSTPNGEESAAEASRRAADAAERSAKAAERAAVALEALIAAQAKPAAATAAAAALPPPKPVGWTGSAGLSLIWLTGNSNTLTFNATGSADRKFGDWGLGLKGYATYGQTAPQASAPTQVTALAAGGKIRGDRSVADWVTLFVAAGADTNHVKSVEYVAYGEAGAGVVWINRKESDYEKAFLRTDLSIHYEHEDDYQYYPTPLGIGERDLLGPRVSGVFRYALKKDILFSQDAEVIPNILGSSRVRVNATTKLASRLTEALSLTASFQLNYDSVPPPNKVSTDTALSLGLEVAL